jgi:hypothetical protein
MTEKNFIDIYTHSGKESIFNIQPASVLRQWMDDTNGWAYNCLPLKIANQYGWVAHSPWDFSVSWNGGADKKDLVVTSDLPIKAKSHFAHGTMTLDTDFLIKTNIGTSLYVRGITNYQKDIIYPMDAIIETDWLPFHFPFSYKLLKPGVASFTKGEPLFMFFPIQRDYVETFEVSFKHINTNAELAEENLEFSRSREKHMSDNKANPQKLYIKGQVAEEKVEIDKHKIKLNLQNPKVV